MTDERRTGLARAGRADPLTPREMVAAIGGVLGIVEAVLPSLLFIVAYQVVALAAAPAPVDRGLLPLVVVPPLALSAVFVVIRLVRRQRVVSALGGALGAGVSAALALLTGDANENFLPGILTNAGYGLVLLLSVLVRRPLIGVAAGLLVPDLGGWRGEPAQRRTMTWLTVLWTALFAVRLVVELPLYLAGDRVVALGVAKIALGLPLYAPVLVLTILVVQAMAKRARPAP
ncbi:DUF3159 domain-containing protein [Amnibacterium endophyticum]|uniref:DUF3159 domain-containing protein n=1 Tax=Amnibacterium endophyticum TaxID=2109337 RepID=A0ABW4LJR8_9MICO